jgi:hypothetical protein
MSALSIAINHTPAAKLSPILSTRLLLLASVLSISAAAWSQSTPTVCADTDRECAFKAGHAHIVKKRAFWSRALQLPVTQRIGPAAPELVDFLRLDTIAQAIPGKPRAPSLTADFIGEVGAALEELPQPVKALLTTKLAGIYFVEDIGGTGFTDMVLDTSGNPVAGFIVLDPTVLHKRTANEWATWKENTPFLPGSEFRLAAEIETGAQNNRRNAIQYILLHELAHVISIGGNIHPSWSVAPKDVLALSSYPYFQMSWTRAKDGSNYESLYEASFPQRKDVVYYFGARLPAAQMVATYENLQRTNFVTLYGATRPGDDFAEAFASYVHTVLMKRPFAIRIYNKEAQVTVFEACWQQPRCAEKKKFLEKLIDAGATTTKTTNPVK